MKRISQILLLLLCIAMALSFAGCRSSKTTVKTSSQAEFKKDSVGELNLKIENKSIMENTGQTNQKTGNSILQNFSANQNATIRDFDTSKPTDPATGKPPLLRETIINNSIQSNSSASSTTNTESKYKDQKNIEAKAEASASAKVKQSGSNKATGNSETKIRSPVWSMPWGWIIVIAIAILLVCDLILNRSRFLLWLVKLVRNR